MLIDRRFWTPAAKERLRFIKNKWRGLSEDSHNMMPYKQFRMEFLRSVGSIQKKRESIANEIIEGQSAREQLIEIIGDKQLKQARAFYNSRRN